MDSADSHSSNAINGGATSPAARRLARRLLTAAALACVPLAGACFSERSFRLHPHEIVRLDAPAGQPVGSSIRGLRAGGAGDPAIGSSAASGRCRSTRDWLVSAHEQLDHLLPEVRPHPARPDTAARAFGVRFDGALLTDDMSIHRRVARDVFRHFGWRPDSVYRLTGNWSGLQQTAQCVGAIGSPGDPPPRWDGFEQVWVPVAEGLELSARLGWSHDERGRVRTAQGLVLLPGLFGDNAILRTRDLAQLLRKSGFHVLAVELRGHGQTEVKYPDVPYTFGVLEVADLLAVSDWFEDHPDVTRTGLIGFCWGANLGLLAAWYDGCGGDHPSISEAWRPYLTPPCPRVHFSGGILAIAPVPRFEELVDDLDRSWSILAHPVYGYLQRTVKARMRDKDYRPLSGSLRELIRLEFHRMGIQSHPLLLDGNRFLRLVDYGDRPAGDKLEDARVPVLILHSVNDPVAPAQDVVDLVAGVDNPMVAAVLLGGGGHGGLPVYAREYYVSLIAGFFDPERGAAAACDPSPARMRDSIARTLGSS